MDGRPQFWPMWPIDCMAQVRGLDDGSGRRPTAKPNTRMQPHRPDRVNQERQQGKEKIHAAGAALDYRARGLTGESIHELLGAISLILEVEKSLVRNNIFIRGIRANHRDAWAERGLVQLELAH